MHVPPEKSFYNLLENWTKRPDLAEEKKKGRRRTARHAGEKAEWSARGKRKRRTGEWHQKWMCFPFELKLDLRRKAALGGVAAVRGPPPRLAPSPTATCGPVIALGYTAPLPPSLLRASPFPSYNGVHNGGSPFLNMVCCRTILASDWSRY
ncbi:U6 snRNA-associated Sm-like protein LSm6 isoform X1 [Stigmatopora nigra]